MKQYETFELSFNGEEPAGSLAQIELSADFYNADKHIIVNGFYAGNGVYKIRFLPEQVGKYHWNVSGLFTAEGEEECEEHEPQQHGIVCVQDTHFVFSDNSRYIPFGTTVYAMIMQEDDLVEQTFLSLRDAPFNKIRICVFPKSYDYNHGDPFLYPFEKAENGEWDTERPCFQFWERMENIIDRLYSMGIQTDLILFHPYDRWGFNEMSQEDNLRYLHYLLCRLAAKPGIWWSLANEYDLTLGKKTIADWTEIEEYVASHDPYGHLISNHNYINFWDATRKNISHASLQTKALTEIPNWIERYKKPVIIDECGYEGDIPSLWGSLSAKEMTNRFWRCYASGGYCTHGETYFNEDEVLWWSKGGILKGESVARISFLKDIMYELPGNLTPVKDSTYELAQIPVESLTLDMLPLEMRETVRLMVESFGRMDTQEKCLYFSTEHVWHACCGTKAYLWFYDLQCYREMELNLPKENDYSVDVIDTWEMIKTRALEHTSGTTMINLPAKEGIAVLALCNKIK